MIDKMKHFSDESLQILVIGNEHSDEFRRTAQHVETCEVCQVRLQELAAPAGFESSVISMLDISSSDAWIETKVVGSHVEATNLDFLSPPSHPEMLGRLGRYEIERVIGSGGMGIVLKAYDTELNRPVAVKVLARHLAHSGAAKARFSREAKAAAAVVHEHVVSIHNVDTEREFPFLVMQFVSGESLQSRVDRDGPLDAKEILRIGIQIAAGLAAAHEQGVIHRDIKPANILLEDRVERVLITDFGLARTVDDASLTHTGMIAGTPHYMSPQQANGDQTDHRTDLFSLGSVLYFMATGHPPFRAERAMGVLNRICHDRHKPLWQVAEELPDELSILVDRLLQKQPANRYGSAGAVREQMVKMLAQLQQPKAGLVRQLRRFSLRYPKRLLAVGVMASSLLFAVTAMNYLTGVEHSAEVAIDPVKHPETVGSTKPEVKPLLDSEEEENFATAIKDLRARVQALNEPFAYSSMADANNSQSTTLQSLHQRLERLQSNHLIESLVEQPGDKK